MGQDMPDWTSLAATAALNGGVLPVGDTIKPLLTFTTRKGFAFTFTVPASDVKQTYGALLVAVIRLNVTDTPYCVLVKPSSGAQESGVSFCAPFAPTATGGTFQAIVPMANVSAAPINVTIFTSGTTSTYLGTVYGLTGNPGVKLRSDGRTYPIGSQKHNTVSGTSALVNAPSSPLRIMVHSISGYIIAKSSGAATLLVYSTSIDALDLVAPASGTHRDKGTIPDSGLLLNTTAALDISANANVTSLRLSVSWDFVV